MDRGAWQATAHKVSKSQTQLSVPLNFLDLSQHVEQTGNTTMKTLQKFPSRFSVNFASRCYWKAAHGLPQYFSIWAREKIDPEV